MSNEYERLRLEERLKSLVDPKTVHREFKDANALAKEVIRINKELENL